MSSSVLRRALLGAILVAPVLMGSAAVAAPAAAYELTLISGGGRAVAVNEVGQVVVNQYGAGRNQSAVWADGALSVLSSAGYTSTTARAINNHGVIVGDGIGAQGGRPVRWDSGVISVVAGASAGARQASGINDDGVIVGTRNVYVTFNSSTVYGQAVKWKNASEIVLGLPDTYDHLGRAAGINENEDVVGEVVRVWRDGEWPQEIREEFEPAPATWLFGQSAPTLLAAYGPPASQLGSAINNHGAVAGTHYTDALGPQATLFKQGQVVTLDGSWSSALGINDLDDVVGNATDPSSYLASATLWSNGARVDLNSFLSAPLIDAGWYLETAYDINNQGWIVGAAFNSITYESAAFVLTPVPEPMAALLGLAGVAVVIWARRQAGARAALPVLTA